MFLRRILVSAVPLLLLFTAASATPIQVQLNAIPNAIPPISGYVLIHCDVLAPTDYTIVISNLPVNAFDVVLDGPAHGQRYLGSFSVTQSRSETTTTLHINMPCPIGEYDRIYILHGTEQILFGVLP